MKTPVTIRYVSGRVEKYEVELWGGSNAQARLNEIIQSPALLLQVAGDLMIIPMSAIESISVSLPKEDRGKLDLSMVRTAKRLN